MQYRLGKETDFINVETFVWQAIFPAFNHPDLDEGQRSENDAIVANAKSLCLGAIALPNQQIFVAYDEAQRRMAGYIIVDKSPLTYPALVCLIVSRKYWGKKVGDGLMRKGLEWLGTQKPITLSVHYYLERAIAFFARFGFENTGEPAGNELIPRLLLLRESGPLENGPENPEQLSLEIEELVTSSDSVEEPIIEESPKENYRSRFSDIEFEIDYGETETTDPDDMPSVEPTEDQQSQSKGRIDFEFAFNDIPSEDSDTETVEQEESNEVDALELLDLTAEEAHTPDEKSEEVPVIDSPSGTDPAKVRLAFQDYFMKTVTDLFGNREAVNYLEALRTDDFQMTVNSSLNRLAKAANWEDKFRPLAGDLAEYFIVEKAAELHGHVFPQRLLRHQAKPVDEAIMFKLIDDFLDLANENERVDTDFITISPKRLKNATQQFLKAGADERIFYLIDQSLLGNLKNGFAFTNKAFYWKALLQPNHVAYYDELEEVKMEKGTLKINGHFFDTGKQAFNLKIALLLKKLSRVWG